MTRSEHQSPQVAATRVDRLVTKAQAAKLLAVSTRTVDRLCAKDLLDKLHVGGSVRFRLSDIEGIMHRGA